MRHTERHLSHDPAEAGELEALAGDVARADRRGARGRGARQRSIGIGVAGTPTSLAAIDQQLDPYDPDQVHGYKLSLDVDPADVLRARRRSRSRSGSR